MKETYSRSKSVWQRMNARERKAAMAYGEKYKAFLDTARTERLAAAEIIRRAEEKGFKPVYTMKSIKAGDKVYWNQKDKSVILAVIGKEPVHEGIKIVGSHIDSPRLDLKANPVHEQDGIVYFRTHYYGGIKKYQWTCIPLALIGVALLWAFLFRTRAGFALQVGGLAPAAARYAGFSSRRALWTALLVSGGAAGLAGALEVAGPIGQLTPYVPAGYGFAAIIVAFVGRLHPVGIVFSAILMSMFYIGGELAQSRLGLPKSLTGVFQGLLLFTLLACDTLIAYRKIGRAHV